MAMEFNQLLWQWQQQLSAGELFTLPHVFLLLGLVLLLLPKLRRIVWDVLETVIASLLLLVLVVVVLGLPFAATYLTFKGVAFTLRSISDNLPHLHDMLSLTVTQHA